MIIGFVNESPLSGSRSSCTHSPLKHFKQAPACKNNAPAFYQCTCCLKCHLSPGVDTQRSPAHTTPGECHLPSHPSRPSLPGKKMRTEQGQRKQSFPCCHPPVCPPAPCGLQPVPAASPFRSHADGNTLLQEDTKEKKYLFQTCSTLETFFKAPVRDGKSTAPKGPSPGCCHDPAGWLWECAEPPCILVPSPMTGDSGCPVPLFCGLKDKDGCHKMRSCFTVR